MSPPSFTVRVSKSLRFVTFVASVAFASDSNSRKLGWEYKCKPTNPA
jgi:hypothetical protein